MPPVPKSIATPMGPVKIRSVTNQPQEMERLGSHGFGLAGVLPLRIEAQPDSVMQANKSRSPRFILYSIRFHNGGSNIERNSIYANFGEKDTFAPHHNRYWLNQMPSISRHPGRLYIYVLGYRDCVHTALLQCHPSRLLSYRQWL